MPESHKAEKRRIQKANVVAGIGDATGRIPMRVKADVKMMKCSKCSSELKATKTNTELKAHATKCNLTLEEAFPGATQAAADLLASSGTKTVKGSKDDKAGSGGKKKKNDIGDLDDLLSAGLSVGKKKGKK